MKIALLCTQDNPKLRPSMPSVVKMLNRETAIMKTSSSYSASSSASESQGNTMSFSASIPNHCSSRVIDYLPSNIPRKIMENKQTRINR
ncbi:hypothetical protein TanjilG_23475 [Lupinus angustifolius]|uniref:Uncharacterized protein n=1 Tax=Lupinus angustifolius TaxID=3871 RepID=A0A4P1R9T1_LUPAN|nr:hypothetical protein TanjilG_23475 [Lupinus angustifolius]